MAQKPESGLQRRIQAALRAAFPHCYVRKIHISEYQSGGIADLLCCIEGWFFAIEVKASGEERSKLQQFEADEVRRARGVTFVGISPEQVVSRVKQVLAEKAKHELGKKTLP